MYQTHVDKASTKLFDLLSSDLPLTPTDTPCGNSLPSMFLHTFNEADARRWVDGRDPLENPLHLDFIS